MFLKDKPTLALEVQAGVAPVDVHRAVINLNPVQQYLYLQTQIIWFGRGSERLPFFDQ